MSNEEIKDEILKTIKPYVVEWEDSCFNDMEDDLLDTIKSVGFEDLDDREKEVIKTFRDNY